MGAKQATGYIITSSSYDDTTKRWAVGGTLVGITGLTVSNFSINDIIYDNSTTYGRRRWVINEIHSSSSGNTLNCYVTYDDSQTLSDPTSQKPNTGGGNGAVCVQYSKTDGASIPSIIEAYITEPIQAQIISDNDAIPTPIQKNTSTAYIVSGQIDGNNPIDPSTLDEETIYIVTSATATSSSSSAGIIYELNEIYQVINSTWTLLSTVSGSQINIVNDLTGGTVEYLKNNIYLYDQILDSWFLSSSNIYIENIELTQTDIDNKYVTLNHTTMSASEISLNIIGGTPQFINEDYYVIQSDNKLYWNGKTLDGVLEVGDKITVTYK